MDDTHCRQQRTATGQAVHNTFARYARSLERQRRSPRARSPIHEEVRAFILEALGRAQATDTSLQESLGAEGSVSGRSR